MCKSREQIAGSSEGPGAIGLSPLLKERSFTSQGPSVPRSLLRLEEAGGADETASVSLSLLESVCLLCLHL